MTSTSPIKKIPRSDGINCLGQHLACVIHDWRMAHGLKISVAARELGVSTATWGHWEETRRMPSLANLQLLALYTGIPIQHFLCPNHKQCPLGRK